MTLMFCQEKQMAEIFWRGESGKNKHPSGCVKSGLQFEFIEQKNQKQSDILKLLE